MLDKALVQAPHPASAPSTVAEVKADNATSSADAKASELNPAKPAGRTWGWLALIAVALALFVGGLIRSRFDSARPMPLREAA
jgi:hypothetical protein